MRYIYFLTNSDTENHRELKTARGHMMPPPQHVCNGLARLAYRSTLTQDIGTDNGTDKAT